MTLAVALSKSPKQLVVDIYEAKATFNEIGAGVGILPRVWEALRSLGLEEQLRERIGTYPGGDLPCVLFIHSSRLTLRLHQGGSFSTENLTRKRVSFLERAWVRSMS